MKTKRVIAGLVSGLIVALFIRHLQAPDYIVFLSFWFAAELGYLIKLLEQSFQITE